MGIRSFKRWLLMTSLLIITKVIGINRNKKTNQLMIR